MKRLLVVLLIAFIFRLLLIPVARHGDMNNNTSWGQLLLKRGPVNFYEGKEWTYSAPNQPPLYLYTFAGTSLFQNTTTSIIAYLNKHLGAFPSQLVWWNDQWGELYWAKLPGIIADLGIAVVIYKFFEKKKKIGLILPIVWLVNPISWYNSGIWGGTDSIVNLLGILSVYYLLTKKNLTLSLLFFVLGMLFKGSLALLLPCLLFVAIREKFKLNDYIKAIVVSAVAVTIVTIPFHLNLDLYIYLIRLYTERFFPGEIGSLTANAFNLWWIVDPDKTLDSTIYLGLTARVWGIIITTISYVFLLFRLKKSSTNKNIILSLSLIPLITFLFMTRIHERYLYPFFPLATISLAEFPWLWVPYTLLSLVNLLNLYHLFWAPGIKIVEAWYLNPTFMIVLSCINIIIFIYIIARYKKSVY